MPELPEVEAARRLVETTCIGKRIATAAVADDNKVIEGIAPADLQKLLEGSKIQGVKRKGKHFWIEFEDDKPALVMHFGMTGGLSVHGVGASKYKRLSWVDHQEWPPRFWKLQLELEDGLKIAYVDARRFGRVRSEADPANAPPLSTMGPDALLELPQASDLAALFKKRARAIKTVLMDQAVLSGIGNWVADEVLYQSGIHPEQPAKSLDLETVQKLRDVILRVCEFAVEVGADSDQFPHDWIFHTRWSKGKPVKVAGHSITFIEVGGRTTAFVPALQKLIGSSSGGAGRGGKRKQTEHAQEGADPGGKPAQGKRGQRSKVVESSAADQETDAEGAEEGGKPAQGKRGQAKVGKSKNAADQETDGGSGEGKSSKGRGRKVGKAVEVGKKTGKRRGGEEADTDQGVEGDAAEETQKCGKRARKRQQDVKIGRGKPQQAQQLVGDESGDHVGDEKRARRRSGRRS